MRCARCHRPLLSDPVMLGEKGAERGYGPTCAAKVAGQNQLPLKPKRVRLFSVRRKKVDTRQASLLAELV